MRYYDMLNKDTLSIDLAGIGSRIRNSRKQLNLSQADLAERTELSMSHISDIENGKINFTVDVLKRLSDALTCSADYILIGADSGNPQLDALISDSGPDELTAILDVATKYKESMRRNLK